MAGNFTGFSSPATIARFNRLRKVASGGGVVDLVRQSGPRETGTAGPDLPATGAAACPWLEAGDGIR